MLMLMAFLMLASPAPDPVAGRACDSKCEAVLTTAFEWAVQQMRNEKRTDPIFDIGQLRTGWGVESPEDRAQTQFLERLAATSGISVLKKEEDPRVQLCDAEPDSRACRAHGGTTFFTLRKLEFVSADEATILVDREVMNSEGLASPSYRTIWILRLRFSSGQWRVAEANRGLLS